jgi:hypothetical protein
MASTSSKQELSIGKQTIKIISQMPITPIRRSMLQILRDSMLQLEVNQQEKP